MTKRTGGGQPAEGTLRGVFDVFSTLKEVASGLPGLPAPSSSPIFHLHPPTQLFNEVHVNLLDPLPYHERLRNPFKGAGRDGIQDKQGVSND